jgi:hypothetical protein
MHIRNITFSLLVTLTTIFTTGSLLAQDAKPKREVGLQFRNFDFNGGGNFSAFYKKQKKENIYRRIRMFSGNLSTGVVGEDFKFNFSAGIAIGREKRKSIDPKLEFYQGPEFSFGMGLSTLNEDDVIFNFSTSFGWVLGLQHSFNDRWAVNLETIPGISISANTNGDHGPDSFFFGAGFNNMVLLGLVRKF